MAWRLTPAAGMVWAQIRPQQRTAIRYALDDLAAQTQQDRDRDIKTLQTGDELVDVIRGPGGYRVFFRREGDDIVILDIASRAQIEFLRTVPESSAA